MGGVGEGVGTTGGVVVNVGVDEGAGVGDAETLGTGLEFGVSDLKVTGTVTASKPLADSIPVWVNVRTPVSAA